MLFSIVVNIFRYLLREYHRKFGGFKFELVYRPINPVNRRFSLIYRYRCGPVNGLPPVIFSLISRRARLQLTCGKRMRRLGPNTSECFCCGRSTGPHCRPIIANLTILFYIYSFLNVPPLLRHFRMIFVYSFLYVWNVTSCVETMEHF